MSFSITVALYGGTKFSSILLAQVVFIPSVQMLSFIASGMPVSGETSPESMRFCAFSAISIALSLVTVM